MKTTQADLNNCPHNVIKASCTKCKARSPRYCDCSGESEYEKELRKKEAQHTPTPWEVNGSLIVKDCYGKVIAETDVGLNHPPKRYIEHKERKANAAFIVRAVNSHEALLHACRRAFYLIKEGGFNHPMTEEFYDDTLKRLEKAIITADGALTNTEAQP